MISLEEVVFLDFDGVIVPLGKASLADMAIAKAVANFNSLLKQRPNLKIVISSHWREHGLSYCRRYLEGLGIDMSRVVALTGQEPGPRGHQVQLFLGRHPSIKRFVILDDKSDLEPLMTKLVKTSGFTGLTKQNIEEAIRILDEERS